MMYRIRFRMALTALAVTSVFFTVSAVSGYQTTKKSTSLNEEEIARKKNAPEFDYYNYFNLYKQRKEWCARPMLTDGNTNYVTFEDLKGNAAFMNVLTGFEKDWKSRIEAVVGRQYTGGLHGLGEAALAARMKVALSPDAVSRQAAMDQAQIMAAETIMRREAALRQHFAAIGAVRDQFSQWAARELDKSGSRLKCKAAVLYVSMCLDDQSLGLSNNSPGLVPLIPLYERFPCVQGPP
ncbi:MAG: hypothetical protein ACKVQA_00505 [Burkholderiales bacterium]